MEPEILRMQKPLRRVLWTFLGGSLSALSVAPVFTDLILDFEAVTDCCLLFYPYDLAYFTVDMELCGPGHL